MSKVATKTISVKLGMDTIQGITAGYIQDMYKELSKDIAKFYKDSVVEDNYEAWEEHYTNLDGAQKLRALLFTIMEESEYREFVMTVNNELYKV